MAEIHDHAMRGEREKGGRGGEEIWKEKKWNAKHRRRGYVRQNEIIQDNGDKNEESLMKTALR